MIFKKRLKKKIKSTLRGFTLIEMLVSMSIFAIITGVVLTRNAQFSGNILIGNLAYDVALSIRQAQVFGMSVREFEVGGVGTFDIGYGVHFDGSIPDSYIFFADLDDDQKYNNPLEAIETLTLRSGYTIANVCGVLTGGTRKCTALAEISFLDVVFKRPDPDANINTNLLEIYSRAEITVASPTGTERMITVWSTGQISVK